MTRALTITVVEGREFDVEWEDFTDLEALGILSIAAVAVMERARGLAPSPSPARPAQADLTRERRHA